MTIKNKLEINYAVHPGITLKEKLEELKMTPEELAIRTGAYIKTVYDILDARSSITAKMADQLEKVLDIPASFWMAKQANYNEYIAKKKKKN